MNVSKLWVDLETYSETPIKNGTYRYTEDAEIMLILYAFDDGEVECVDLTDPLVNLDDHKDFFQELEHGTSELWASNSMFDRNVLKYSGYPTPIERWRDTMVQALCHALPGALGKLCDIFNLGEGDAKMKEGRSLIQLFCKPRPKNMKLRRATYETHPEQWAKFIEYGKSDIKAMRALHYAMPKFNYPTGRSGELTHWHLDQKINDRGFTVDLDLVNAAIDSAKSEKASLKKQGFDTTNGAVTSLTKRDQVLEHILLEYGIPLPDLTKATLERRLNDPDIPRGVKELLALRLQATTTSTSKYIALLKSLNNDGKCRGTIQFAGASRTGRACLAEGSKVDVRTMTGQITQKPIEEVKITDEVWDGQEWVFHNGVEFSGYKEVIEHEGVRATSDHIVWVSATEKVTLGEAKEKGVKLWNGRTIKGGLTVETPANSRQKMRVATYDIINAGPRNRFRANGKIVSNSGRTYQPQNLPSRGLLEDCEIDFGIDALKAGEADFFYPNIMKLLSSCVRGALIASPGKMLAVADLSAIEGRFAAWVSGEEWVLDAYRKYDSGVGPDMYQVTYANAFKIDVEEVTKAKRQIGKVMTLFLGYGGGVGAFVAGALGYGFDLEELAKDNWDTLPDAQLKEANSFYGYVIKRKMPTFGLSKEAFITCDVLKRLWREANPNIASMWTRLEEAIRAAINHPGEVYEAGEFIKVMRKGTWLRVLLPSGRSLCYANPRLSEKGEISFMGMNQYTRQWQRIKTYGGMSLENLTQAGSRDILYGSMPHAEAAGFQIVLHVHDELVTEFDPKTELTIENLCEIMSAPVPWAPGLPLAAAGFISDRYRK